MRALERRGNASPRGMILTGLRVGTEPGLQSTSGILHVAKSGRSERLPFGFRTTVNPSATMVAGDRSPLVALDADSTHPLSDVFRQLDWLKANNVMATWKLRGLDS